MSLGPGCLCVSDRAQCGPDRVTVTYHRPNPETDARELVGIGVCWIVEGVGPLEAERRARKEALREAAKHDKR